MVEGGKQANTSVRSWSKYRVKGAFAYSHFQYGECLPGYGMEVALLTEVHRSSVSLLMLRERGDKVL